MIIPQNDVEVIPIFPCISMLINTNPEFQEVKSGLIDYIYQERENDKTGLSRSNEGGWHSNTNIMDDPKFSQYKEFLEKYITKCFERFVIDQSIIRIDTSWANINPPGTSNTLHHHPSCDVSGCIWIKAEKDAGALRMLNPNEFTQDGLLIVSNDDIKERYKYSSNYYFNPIEGNLILFPSHLFHSVTKNMSKEDRISIAFNIRTFTGR